MRSVRSVRRESATTCGTETGSIHARLRGGEFQLSSNHGWIEVGGYGRAACQGAARRCADPLHALRFFAPSPPSPRRQTGPPLGRFGPTLGGEGAVAVESILGCRPAWTQAGRCRPSPPGSGRRQLATARGAYAELSFSRFQRSSVRRGRFTRTPSPVRTTNTRLSSGSARPASSTTRSPSQIAGAIESPATRAHIRRSGAPMRAAPTAPRTPPPPWSRPIRARRTRPRIGRWPRTVRSRRAFPPRRTRPPAFRAGDADLEVRHRSAEGYGENRDLLPPPPLCQQVGKRHRDVRPAVFFQSSLLVELVDPVARAA